LWTPAHAVKMPRSSHGLDVAEHLAGGRHELGIEFGGLNYADATVGIIPCALLERRSDRLRR
jgi:hypothetical protein